jgi:hypothetical protein
MGSINRFQTAWMANRMIFMLNSLIICLKRLKKIGSKLNV